MPEPTYPYGILPHSLRDLVVNAMVCGWVALVISCSALYLASGRFVWSRKKTAGVILLAVVGGVFLNFASWFYQVKPYTLDAEFVYSGYPFVWSVASRSVFWGSSGWTYDIQWYGLIGNVALYAWAIFGVLIGFFTLRKRIVRIVHPQ
jgi:hypothetical protein